MKLRRPQPIVTSMDAPGAKERAQSAGLIELGQLEKEAKQQGLQMRMSNQMPHK